MLVVGALSWLLFTIDAAFSGFRAAAGRSFLLDKTRWYADAMRRGVIAAQVVAVVTIAVYALLSQVTPQGGVIARDLQAAGATMMLVFLPFAGIVLATLVLRAVPSVDVRSTASVLVFGPLTLARPTVLVVGLGFGLAKTVTWPSRVLLVAIVACALAMGPLLGRRYVEREARFPV